MYMTGILIRSPSHLHIPMVVCNQVDRYLPVFAFVQSIDFAHAQTLVCSRYMYMPACRMPHPPYDWAVASLTPIENRKLISRKCSRTSMRPSVWLLWLS